MAYVDVINDFSNGATGTLTDINGDPVGYSVAGTSSTTNWQSLVGGARVNGNGAQQFELTFDQPVVGAAIRFSGSDKNEAYYVTINGSTVDLAALVASGDATITQSGAASHVLRPDGGINGDRHPDGSIADIVFNFPVTSIGAFGSGSGVGNWDFVEVGIDDSTFDVVCFAKGTQLATPKGDRAVEDLEAGDVVQTFFDKPAVVRWIGSRVITQADLHRNAKLFPVRIAAGALGDGVPKRDILVSRQHRVMVSSRIADRMFGSDCVLVPAIKLTGFPGITVDDTVQGIAYYHVLCDEHSVLVAEGGPFESLLMGQQTGEVISDEADDPRTMKIPLGLRNTLSQMPALTIPTGARLRNLLERHRKNNQPLFHSLAQPNTVRRMGGQG